MPPETSPLRVDNPLLEGLWSGAGTAYFLALIVVAGVICAEGLKVMRGKPVTQLFSRDATRYVFLLGLLDVTFILILGPLFAILIVAPLTSKECFISGLSWIALVQSAAKDG
jgi:hypothetical protein